MLQLLLDVRFMRDVLAGEMLCIDDMSGSTHTHTVCLSNSRLKWVMIRVDQNRISAPYMTMCVVISLLEIPYVHRMYL